MKIKLIILLSLFLAYCTSPTMDEKAFSEIVEITGCDNINLKYLSTNDTQYGKKKILEYIISNPSKIDIKNIEQLKNSSTLIIKVIFNDASKIDTTFTDYNIVFKKGTEEFAIEYTLEELFASLGIDYLMNKEPEKAIPYFTHAIKVKPTEIKFYKNRAVAYYRLKDFKKALTDFQTAYKLDTNDPNTLNSIALCYLEDGLIDSASITINNCIMENPDYGSAYRTRAKVYKKNKDYENSIQDFQTAISINPDAPLWRRELSETYFEIGDYENALNSIENSLEIDDSETSGLILKGKILIKLEKIDEACEYLNMIKDNKEAKKIIEDNCEKTSGNNV